MLLPFDALARTERRTAGATRCGKCFKVFRSRHYLDRHFLRKHADMVSRAAPKRERRDPRCSCQPSHSRPAPSRSPPLVAQAGRAHVSGQLLRHIPLSAARPPRPARVGRGGERGGRAGRRDRWVTRDPCDNRPVPRSPWLAAALHGPVAASQFSLPPPYRLPRLAKVSAGVHAGPAPCLPTRLPPLLPPGGQGNRRSVPPPVPALLHLLPPPPLRHHVHSVALSLPLSPGPASRRLYRTYAGLHCERLRCLHVLDDGSRGPSAAALLADSGASGGQASAGPSAHHNKGGQQRPASVWYLPLVGILIAALGIYYLAHFVRTYETLWVPVR